MVVVKKVYMSYVPPKLPPGFYAIGNDGDSGRRHDDDDRRSHRHRHHRSSDRRKRGGVEEETRRREEDKEDEKQEEEYEQRQRQMMMMIDRLQRVTFENGIDFRFVADAWMLGPWPNVGFHLFDPQNGGHPRFTPAVDVWKPVIRAYFAWCEIPKEACAQTWAEIVDMLLKMPELRSLDPEFRAWAFECFCVFQLEKMTCERSFNSCCPHPLSLLSSSSTSSSYDPMINWSCEGCYTKTKN